MDGKMFQAYIITCGVSARRYVGITGRSLAKRWSEHVYDAKRGRTVLARAIAKYGPENFSIESICGFRSWASAQTVEDALIRQHGTMAPAGYNSMPGGRGRSIGFKPSPEAIERSAAAHRGLPCHPNTIAAAHARKGVPKPLGHRAKIAAKCPEAAAARADLRAQLVRYFCDWNHLPTAANLSIGKREEP
jgi:group I intron endonuclease